MLLRRLGFGRLWGDALWAAVVAVAFSMVVFWPLLPHLDDPWSGGDMLSTYVNTNQAGVLGYTPTTRFGFPLGMDLNLAPGLDLVENWAAWLVKTVAGTTFAGLNVVLIASFPAVAAVAVLAIRLAGLRGPFAVALAVAFAFIPYHWGRGLGHTYLATMVSAVVGLVLVLAIGSGRLTAWLRTAHARGGRHLAGAIALLALAIVVVAWTGMYYAAFTLILGAAALLWRLAHGVHWRALLVDALPLAGIVVLVAIAFVPSLVTLADNPGARELTERLPVESVIHAGALTLALLPLPMSRLPFMAGYNEWATTMAADGGGVEATSITNFGTWTTTVAVLVMVAGLLVPRWRARSSSLLPLVGYLTVVALLFFVPWGLGTLVANAVTPQLRGWNRLLVVILLLVIVGAAAVLSSTRLNLDDDRSRDDDSERPSAGGWAVVAAGAVLLVTLVDAVAPFRAPYRASVEESAAEMAYARAYASDVNAAIPGDCGILQLPHAVYPEQGKLETLNDYEHFRVALGNLDKRWSYGALKQTDAGDWAERVKPLPSNADIERLVAAGFCGIHVDARGFANDGFTIASIELESRLGPPVATGHDGDWLMFALPRS